MQKLRAGASTSVQKLGASIHIVYHKMVIA